MDNWLAILRAVDGILSTVAAAAVLINTLVRVRHDAGASGSARRSDGRKPE